jgi:O-antigen/teichoic acid export membrane protein
MVSTTALRESSSIISGNLAGVAAWVDRPGSKITPRCHTELVRGATDYDGEQPRDLRERESSTKRLFANTSALVASRLTVAVLGWGGTIIIARQLDNESFGQFVFVFSLLGMLSIVTDLGVGRLIVGGLVRDEDPAGLAGTYILLRTLLGFIGYGVAVFVVVLAGYPDPVIHATAVAGLVVVLATPASAYLVAFQVTDRLARVSVAETFGQTAQMALTVAVAIQGGSIVWFTVPAVVNHALVLVWKIPAAHRLIPFRYHIDLGLWWKLLKEAVPLSAGAAFATLYYRVDSVMLASIDDFTAVGLYGVAYKFVDLVHFIPSALSVAILAPLAAAWPDRPLEFAAHVRHGLLLLVIAAGGFAVGFWLFATQAVTLLYGSDFSEAGRTTSIIVSGEALAFVSTLLVVVLIATGRHRAYPIIMLIGLTTNIGLNLILIPRYSFEGAAIATIATEALVLAMLVWFVVRAGDLLPDGLGSLLRLPVAMAAAGLAGLALDGPLPWPAAAACTGLIYLLTVELVGAAGPGGLRRLGGRVPT